MQVIGSFLEGDALRWYDDEVTGLHHYQRDWTFEEVILGLFTRFVQATTMHIAAEKFDATKYNPRKGVRAYKAELQRWGSRMTRPPNAYTLRKTFLDGLPSSIITKMIERGATPELPSLNKMVKTVARIEDNKTLTDYYISTGKKARDVESPYFIKRMKNERREGSSRLPQ